MTCPRPCPRRIERGRALEREPGKLTEMESVTGTAECRVHDAQVKYIAINKEEPTAVSHNPATPRFKRHLDNLPLSNREFRSNIHGPSAWSPLLGIAHSAGRYTFKRKQYALQKFRARLGSFSQLPQPPAILTLSNIVNSARIWRLEANRADPPHFFPKRKKERKRTRAGKMESFDFSF